MILFLQGSGTVPFFIKKELGNIFFTRPFNVSNFLNKYNFLFISPSGIDILYDINKLSNSFTVVDSLNIPPLIIELKII